MILLLYFGDIAGKEWGEMTNEEKLPYEKQSQEEQRKYELAMAEWRKVS